MGKPEPILPVTIDPRFPIRVPVLRFGPVAARVLLKAKRGRVSAVFERSFYCEIADAHICIGSSSLDMGPLHMRVRNLPASLDLCVGMPVAVSDDCIRIGDRFLLTLAGASTWVPPSVPVWSAASARSGLEKLVTFALPRLPRDGLGRFLEAKLCGETADSPVLRQAAVPLKRLQIWLREALLETPMVGDPDAVFLEELLGLGPGLTPSGDDLIGGVMLALNCLGEKPVLAALSSAVMPIMTARTHLISAAHLKAAMEGLGCESAHMIVSAILAGDHEKCVEAIKAVDRVGHTSGWDMLAGMVIAVQLWLDALQSDNTSPE